MLDNYLEELQSFLQSEIREFNVVVMPDFFIDRLVNLNWNVKTFSEKLEAKVQRKGGSIDGISQMEIRGGNAINTASALASLCVKVTPIVCTNNLGLQMMKHYLKKRTVDLSHVKIFKNASITTAMELKGDGGKVNVMLRDVGALANFGPQNLNDGDFEVIENADYVCIFNWAGTRLFGTELAQTVFSHVKKVGRGKTYYDTADPTPNKRKIPELVRKILQTNYVDVLSVNENEAICYASQLSCKVKAPKNGIGLDDWAVECAKILAAHIPARIDLHATSLSATFTKKGETVIPAFNVPVLRATGAGDAWDAGNILGDAYNLSDGCRLALANAVAAYYISNPNGEHPTRKHLIKFCEKLKRKMP